MNKFTGLDLNKRKMPKKPAREGLLCYLLVDQSGFILNLDWEFAFKEVHTKMDTRIKRIVDVIKQNYEGVYQITGDAAFGSKFAAEYCNENNLRFLFSTKSNRKGLAPVWKYLHSYLLEKGNTDQLFHVQHENLSTIAAVSFFDKGFILCLSLLIFPDI